MGATSRFILLLIILLTFWHTNAQTQSKSFGFDDEPIGHVVQTIVESYELYVSYDPKIFKNQPNISLELRDVTLEEALNSVLGNNFNFKKINEYVIIKITEEATTPQVQPEKPKVIRDTVYLEKTLPVYDTIIHDVEREVLIYDTLITKKQVVIYDTVSITPEVKPRRWQIKSHLAPQIWIREDKTWKGVSLGLSYQYEWNKFHLEAGISYIHSFCNTSFTSSETRTELQVDTVSTFYVIENEERVPVYIVDSTYQTNEYITQTSRTNTTNQLALSLLIGKNFRLSDQIKVGIQAGFNVSWILDADEIMQGSNSSGEQIVSYDYRLPLQNIQVEIPFTYSLPGISNGYYLAPFGQVGLNPDYQDTELYSKRFIAGLKFGLIF